MPLFFMICAVVGGTILICQFVLTVVGLGGEHGVDYSHDLAHDFSGDAGHDAGADSGHHDGHAHSSSWLFAVISFRTLVAAATFFGLVGLAAQSAAQPVGVQLLLATAAGVGAMYGVHWLVRAMGRMGEDATTRIHHALGKEGTVYVPVPAAKAHADEVRRREPGFTVESYLATLHYRPPGLPLQVARHAAFATVVYRRGASTAS